MKTYIPARARVETAARVVMLSAMVFKRVVLKAVPLTTESTMERPTTAVTSATTPCTMPMVITRLA